MSGGDPTLAAVVERISAVALAAHDLRAFERAHPSDPLRASTTRAELVEKLDAALDEMLSLGSVLDVFGVLDEVRP